MYTLFYYISVYNYNYYYNNNIVNNIDKIVKMS